MNGKETQASHLFRGNSTSGRRSSNNNNNNNNNKDFLSVNDKATSPRASKKMGKRNIKAQVKKFRMETKGECQMGLLITAMSVKVDKKRCAETQSLKLIF